MIKFFRQSYAIQYVVLALIAIALWLPAFIAGEVETSLGSSVTPLYNLINRLLSFSPFLMVLFAFLWMVMEALMVNAMLVESQIITKVSTMGAFVFMLMTSLTMTQTNFYPFALASVFILLTIHVLFGVYQSQDPTFNLLNAGIFVALASMMYFPSIVLIPWIFVSLIIAKEGKLRLQLLPLLGFFLVYFLYFSCVYIFGDLLAVLNAYKTHFGEFRLSIAGFNTRTIAVLVMTLVPAIILMFGKKNSSFEKTIAVRIRMMMTALLAVIALLLLFFPGTVLMHGLIFIVLTIFFSYEFSYMGNTGWAELFLFFFVALVFANHYFFKWL